MIRPQTPDLGRNWGERSLRWRSAQGALSGSRHRVLAPPGAKGGRVVFRRENHSLGHKWSLAICRNKSERSEHFCDCRPDAVGTLHNVL
jgi:hypothetical protein